MDTAHNLWPHQGAYNTDTVLSPDGLGLVRLGLVRLGQVRLGKVRVGNVMVMHELGEDEI